MFILRLIAEDDDRIGQVGNHTEGWATTATQEVVKVIKLFEIRQCRSKNVFFPYYR